MPMKTNQVLLSLLCPIVLSTIAISAGTEAKGRIGLIRAAFLAQNQNGISLVVTDPRPGAVVGRELTVKGTLRGSKDDAYVWVLVRRIDFDPLWWPQRNAKVDPNTGDWQAVAVFGDPQDIG